MIDTRCLTFAFVSLAFACKARLLRLDIGRRTINTAAGTSEVTQVVQLHIDINRH
jgi:hypothetical protein